MAPVDVASSEHLCISQFHSDGVCDSDGKKRIKETAVDYLLEILKSVKKLCYYVDWGYFPCTMHSTSNVKVK